MVTIEKTTENGYETKEYDNKEAVDIINTELENSRSIFLDGQPFQEELIEEKHLEKVHEVSITNMLGGG